MIKSGNILLISLLTYGTLVGQHPRLTLSPAGVENIKSNIGSTPLFEKQLKKIAQEIDVVISTDIDVPIPKDMAGGYTHEQHKLNYKLMHKAGNLYQFTGKEKYARFVKDMLFAYADLYPTLPLHPTNKSYSTGKIFWQCLNDANWLVFSSQAYDCIYEYLSPKEKDILEKQLFVPFANFLSIENPRFFNRIHNHSTWANAAVGLIALVMDNDTLLQKALYGLDRDKKQTAGFLAQLDYSFSPSGYFSEGPYYQRYAIFPFLVFSHALHNNKPDLNIFEYRDEILLKATKTLLQLTDPKGNFFPFNDAQKGMNYKSYEVVNAVDLMYFIKKDDVLLDWAAKQNQVALNEAGFYVAQNLETRKANAILKSSVLYGDGVNGDAGGIAVLRVDNTDVVFKYSSHGMGHGHFDRLSYSMYDTEGEVIQDYGAVRWVNVDQKGGGRYLPENKTFGKQTIGHNTVVINQESQFNATVKKAEHSHPELYHADFSDPNVQFVAAKETHAYGSTDLSRYLILINDKEFSEPLLADIFTIASDQPVTIDLPLWFQGHIMQSSFDCSKQSKMLAPLGDTDGYQHIWKEANCTLNADSFQFNWLNNQRFYTMHSVNSSGDEIIMGRAGANDPKYNLRSDPVLIHRKKNMKQAVYFNVIETHGKYDTTTEIPIRPYSQLQNISIDYFDQDMLVCSFLTDKNYWKLHLSLKDNDKNTKHSVIINNKTYYWEGVYNLEKLNYQ